MKTQNKNTLGAFLAKANSRHNLYGDMMVTKLKGRNGKIKIQFSKRSNIYLFDWDIKLKSWVLLHD